MAITRRDLLAAAGATVLAGTAFPLAALAATASVAGRTMGTTWHASVPEGMDPDTVRTLVATVFDRVDDIFSPYRPASEMTRFNLAVAADPVTLSPELATVMAAGLAIAGKTGGAFNPAVGGLVARYGFGPIVDTGDIDYRHLRLEGGKAAKADPRATFDPCGIAKGYALDLAVAALAARTDGGFVVELGGEVRTRGRHPSGRDWQVGIERPVPGAGPGVERLVRLGDAALATSGDRVQSYELGGRHYHHIIDPATGLPSAKGVASVSVIAPSAMTADALATALMVMGPEDGLAFAGRENLPVLFIVHEDGGLRELRSAAFAPYIVV